jgi:hypothetical protein
MHARALCGDMLEIGRDRRPVGELPVGPHFVAQEFRRCSQFGLSEAAGENNEGGGE